MMNTWWRVKKQQQITKLIKKHFPNAELLRFVSDSDGKSNCQHLKTQLHIHFQAKGNYKMEL